MAQGYTRVRITAFILFAAVLTISCVILGDPNLTLTQLALILGATFGVSRILSREAVSSPIREASFKLKLDELVTCPRCLGVWVALFLVIGSSLFPTQFLLVCIVFTVSGLNILAQEVMGILVRLTDTLDMLNIPYTSHPDYGGESEVRINKVSGE
jgi:hypothetical protein